MKSNSKTPIHKRPWSDLTPRQKRLRRVSLGILRTSRNSNRSLTRIVREYNEISNDRNISTKTVIRNTDAFTKKNRRWTPKESDTIPRMMEIGEKGKTKSIEVTSSKEASKIGRYHRAVRESIEGDDTNLKKFKNVTITDSKGRRHKLETDRGTVKEINEKARATDFPEVYSK